jgi:hypothetical protein
MTKCACGKYPIFGFFGKKAICCSKCKEDGMEDVVNKKCPCGKRLTFGFPGEKATCCSKCKEDGMENVANKKCTCGKKPHFGFHGEKATCCADCKHDMMENVVHEKCSCGKRLTFGFPGEKATCCSKCKEDGMVDVMNKKCPCGKIPTFGFPGKTAFCCIDCKEVSMENVVSKKCKGYNGVECPTNYRLSTGRDYCLACDPDETRRLNRKRDEAVFFNFLNKHITITQRDYPVHFKCIDTNKTLGRIDGVIITKDVVVCLELDEDAHEAYDTSCEEARMHNVSAELKIAYPDHNIAWVRVNPHTKNNGKRDTSKKAMKMRDNRHREALKIIEDILQTPRDCTEYIGY